MLSSDLKAIAVHRNAANARVVWVIFGLIFVAAVFLRTFNLGKFTFHPDELVHVLAAQGLLEGGQPTLPSGLVYTRGAAFTRVMAETFRFLPQNEASARIPSVVFNLLLMLAVVYLSRRWYGPKVALVAAFLFAVSPLDVLMSRFARMYAPLGLTYFLSTILVYAALNQDRKVRERVLYLLGACAALALSMNLHPLALTFFPGFGIFCLVMSRRERQYRVLVGIGFLILGLLVIEWNFLAGIWHQATTKLSWVSVSDPLKFVKFLWGHYTWLCLVYPMGIAVVLWKDGKRGAYLACNFLVPLLLLTAVARTQAQRYIAHLMPFFLIPTAVGITFLCEVGYAGMKGISGTRRGSYARKAAFVIVPVMLGGVLLSTSEWVQESVGISLKRTYMANRPVPIALLSDVVGGRWTGKGQRSGLRTEEIYQVMDLQFPAWREAATYLKNRIRGEDIVVVTRPMGAYYYLGRVDYSINPGIASGTFNAKSPNGGWITKEKYIGSRYITSLGEIKMLTHKYRRGWIVVTGYHFLDREKRRPKNEIGRYFYDQLKVHQFPSRSNVTIFSWGIDSVNSADLPAVR